jgi:hypothetical protein
MSDRNVPAAQASRKAISSYVRRAEVLRQIHGRKASIARQWEVWYLVVTVIVATVVTALGFAGTERIALALPTWLVPTDQATDAVELTFSIAVLIILILTLVGLVYRYGERANQHFRSVEILTEFIRDVSDEISMHDAGARTFSPARLDVVRTRYKGILGALPANTDREYLRAKQDAKRKRALARMEPSEPDLPAAPRMKARLISRAVGTLDKAQSVKLAGIVASDSSRVAVLSAVEQVFGTRGWVVGGFVREAVWDSQEGATVPPPLREVDVVYFDKADITKDAEDVYAAKLRGKLRNVDWSVKNQARMHLVNGHDAYRGIPDALSRAPETASAVAIQLRRGVLRVMAPLGLDDLFGLKLRKSPLASRASFEARSDRIMRADRWPHLEKASDK